MENDIIVHATDIHKTYHTGEVDVPALRGVDLRIERGEVIAVMGPSGCGKTTLLNCLSGLDLADQGMINIEGNNLIEMSDQERTDYRARSMGFVFQFYNLLPVLNAVENVEMPLLVSGVRPQTAREQALEALDQVGLSERAYHRPAALSGGERQRVTLARALVNRPVIVWADEPTGELDTENTMRIMELMRELNRELDQTFAIVTHDPMVAGYTRRKVTLRDGKVEEDQLSEGID